MQREKVQDYCKTIENLQSEIDNLKQSDQVEDSMNGMSSSPNEKEVKDLSNAQNPLTMELERNREQVELNFNNHTEIHPFTKTHNLSPLQRGGPNINNI